MNFSFSLKTSKKKIKRKVLIKPKNSIIKNREKNEIESSAREAERGRGCHSDNAYRASECTFAELQVRTRFT
jgi:hypothetical protein